MGLWRRGRANALGGEGPIFWPLQDWARASSHNVKPSYDVRLPPLVLDYSVRASSIVNDGHTIQVNFPEGNFLAVSGRRFALRQAHFHAPSENYFNGKGFAFEAHFVYEEVVIGALAVLAILYELKGDNPGITELWRNLPREKNKEFDLPEGFDAESTLPESRDYVYFSGSLTTPPCSEGVRWHVLEEFPPISETQVRTFIAAIGSSSSRPLQEGNARLILD